MDHAKITYVRGELDGLRSVTISLDTKLIDDHDSTSRYSSPIYADASPKLTLEGSELKDLLINIQGLLDLEYASVSFRFRIGDAFDDQRVGREAVGAIFDALDTETLILISNNGGAGAGTRSEIAMARRKIAQTLDTHVFNVR